MRGYAVYAAAITDFVFVVDGLGEMFITGPAIIKEITGEEITFEKLGGARVCTQVNGAADFLVASEQECFQQIRRLLSYFPPTTGSFPRPAKQRPRRPAGSRAGRPSAVESPARL